MPQPHVIGVRLDSHGVGIHVYLKGVRALELPHALHEIAIALIEYFDDVLVFLSGKPEPEPVVLDTPAPQLAHFRFVFWPGFLFAHELVTFVLPKIKTVFEQSAGVGKTLGRAPPVKIENGKWNRQVFFNDGVVELGPISGKTIDVRLNEIELFGIQGFQILIEYPLGQSVVERNLTVVETGQHFSRQVCRLGLLLYWRQLRQILRARAKRRTLRCRRQGK